MKAPTLSMRLPVIVFMLLVLVSSMTTSVMGVPEYEDHSLMLVKPPDGAQLNEFLKRHYDIVEQLPDGRLRIVATERDRVELISDYEAEVEIENVEEYNRSRLDPTKDMGGFSTYAETNSRLMFFSLLYPDLTDVDTIGYSLEGRVILSMKISDNVEIDEDEPEVFINGLIHAREPISIEIVLDLMEHLLDNYYVDPEIQALVDETEIWLVPIINPDGYVYNEMTNPEGGGMWRKNLRDNLDGTYGVDLNRNFGFLWGLDDIGSSPIPEDPTYRGVGPFSEPETQVVRDLIVEHEFSVIVNYHSYGDMYIKPWGFNRSIGCSDDPIYMPVLDTLQALNGYSITQSLYVTNGGAYDWQYGEQFEKRKAIAFLPEVGYWFWPDPGDIGWIVDENLQANLFAIRLAQRMWDRPTRSVGTIFTHYLDSIGACENANETSQTVVFTNVDESDPIDVAIDFVNTTSVDGWFSVDAASATLGPAEEISTSFHVYPDSLYVLPDGDHSLRGYLRLIVTDYQGPPQTDTLMFSIAIAITIEDADDDIICDSLDNCLLIFNPGQADSDSDGLGDSCDNCIFVWNEDQEDADGDEVGDSCDNCIDVFNPDQADSDGNDVGDACDWLCGDADASGAVDIDDVVYLIQYIFAGGPTPDPLESGDADCSGDVDIDDVVYLINYIFAGGPAPCDPDGDEVPDC